MANIHHTADVDREAEIAEDVEIGAYTIIGKGVRIGKKCKIAPHVVLRGPLTLGESNIIDPFCSLGGAAQHLTATTEGTELIIGSNNIFREYVSISRGTKEGGGATRIGNYNLIMSTVHVGHDCVIGDYTIIATGSGIAGHVIIEDFVYVSGMVGISQRCRIGKLSYIVGFTAIDRDLPPFTIAAGRQLDQERTLARARGINVIGLRRRNVSREAIRALQQAYRLCFVDESTVKDALAEIERTLWNFEEVRYFCKFIEETKCGITREARNEVAV